jgi:hypothetical protein
MGRNLETLEETGKFDIPRFDTQEENDFFAERAEWRLERLRRTDFDLTGEHADQSRSVLSIAAEETERHYS